MTIGKLSTAIKIVLLLALAAMLERRVKEEANPKEVKRMVAAKMDWSNIGLPRKRINKINPEKESRLQSRKL